MPSQNNSQTSIDWSALKPYDFKIIKYLVTKNRNVYIKTGMLHKEIAEENNLVEDQLMSAGTFNITILEGLEGEFFASYMAQESSTGFSHLPMANDEDIILQSKTELGYEIKAIKYQGSVIYRNFETELTLKAPTDATQKQKPFKPFGGNY